MLKLNRELGTKFEPVHFKSAPEGMAAVMGGHVDCYFANVGDMTSTVRNKELKAIAIMYPERSKFLPDVPTLKEAVGSEVTSWSGRGIGAAKGIDKEKLDKLIDLYERSYTSNGVCVVKNYEVCDSDFTSIWINDGVLYFEFMEDDIDDYKYYVSDIKEILFEDMGNMIVSIIKINNGDTILVHNL
jgi:hypothetical protein